ncbi:MAG: hypothetical protein AAF367_01605 [Pseudomonadota bacterium]
MRFLLTVLAMALLGGHGALADDSAQDRAFRACVAAVDEAAITTSYHKCTGTLAAPCGASATASDAVACISDLRIHLETHIAAETEILAAANAEKVEEVEFYLADSRAAGDSSCAVMASQDASAGLATGQRAVNGAFCALIVSGDVYALILNLQDRP